MPAWVDDQRPAERSAPSMSMPQETHATEGQAPRDEMEGPNSSNSFVLIDEAHRHDMARTGIRAGSRGDDYVGTTGGPSVGTRRVNVNFAPSAYATLERLAARKGKTMSEVLRDAIQLES